MRWPRQFCSAMWTPCLHQLRSSKTRASPENQWLLVGRPRVELSRAASYAIRAYGVYSAIADRRGPPPLSPSRSLPPG